MKRMILALTLGLLIGSATTALAATSDTVQAVFAEFRILVNGEEKQLETTPLVVKGASYLPVREVAGLLGAEVDYDDATRTIKLDQKDGAATVATTTEEWVWISDLAKTYKDMEISTNNYVLTLKSNGKTADIKFIRDQEGNIISGKSDDGKIELKVIDSKSYLSLNQLKAYGLID